MIMALKYKYSITASILCSAMVAVLWGANITAVYPFVQIVFQGKTVHDWVDEEITKVDHLKETAQADEPQDGAHLDKKLARLEYLQNLSNRYAPRDAFTTLLWILAFLAAGTLIKCVFRVASLVLVSRAAGRTARPCGACRP